MGVNCLNVRTVITFGPPDEIDEYIQQTGRAGRDGLPSTCILVWSKDNIQFASDRMKDYCRSEECHRDFLSSDFDNYCKYNTVSMTECCDFCCNTLLK